MKKLLTFLATFAMLCAVGCGELGGDDVNPDDKPNTEQPSDTSTNVEDLSFQYLISQSSYAITYNADGTSTTSPITRHEYKYDGHKKTEYDLYVEDAILSSSRYTYDGLICIDENGTIIEYLDDTFLRVKSQTTASTISMIEYDGKRIINQKTYYNNNLIYESRYEYNDLVATVYARDYNYETKELSDWKLISKITFLDKTYLRIKEQIGYAEEFTTYYYAKYDETKLLKDENWIDFGEYSVLSFSSEYTYDGLKCYGVQLAFDSSNPQNTNPISKTIIEQIYLE